MTMSLLTSLFACLSPTGLGNVAVAAETDYCSLSCVDLAENRVEVCESLGEGSCAVSGQTFYDQCLVDCPLEVSVPSASEMKAHAQTTAEELWGTVYLVSTHTYLHADGDPNTYLYAFSTDSKASLTAIDLDALNGSDIEGYDETLYFLEMGARLELPPVLAYWNGISREQSQLATMEFQVLKETGSTKFDIDERWGTSVLPIFTLETESGNYYYSPEAQSLSKELTMTVNTDLRKTDAYLLRLERLKREWAAFLGIFPDSSK